MLWRLRMIPNCPINHQVGPSGSFLINFVSFSSEPSDICYIPYTTNWLSTCLGRTVFWLDYGIKANLIYIPLTITTWCWGSSSLQFGVTTLLLLLNWLEPATQIELDEINKVIKLGSGVQTTRYQNKYIVTSTKGQLILKCPFGSVFKSSKKPTIVFPGFLS